MRKKTHLQMGILGLFGLFLTFRREIHEFTRIDRDQEPEEEMIKQIQTRHQQA